MTDAAPLFVDTSFWIALLNRRDEHHARAVRWKNFVAATRTRLITSEAVLWEWLNASGSPLLRGRAAQGYRRCHGDDGITVVGFDDDLVRQAVALYEQRPDKGWSLTDCFSFVAMNHTSLRGALATDHHFKQAGFEPLLLQDPPNP
jgi:predicted nucleic acid-binding protein